MIKKETNMKSKKVFIVTLLTAVCLSAAAYAGKRARNHFPLEGALEGAGLLKTLVELELTDAQKQDIAEILRSRQEIVRADVQEVVEARTKLFQEIHADELDEAKIRLAYSNVAKAGEELAVERAKLVHEIRPVLTSEQQKSLDELRDRMVERIPERIERAASAVDRWIEKHTD